MPGGQSAPKLPPRGTKRRRQSYQFPEIAWQPRVESLWRAGEVWGSQTGHDPQLEGGTNQRCPQPCPQTVSNESSPVHNGILCSQTTKEYKGQKSLKFSRWLRNNSEGKAQTSSLTSDEDLSFQTQAVQCTSRECVAVSNKGPGTL